MLNGLMLNGSTALGGVFVGTSLFCGMPTSQEVATTDKLTRTRGGEGARDRPPADTSAKISKQGGRFLGDMFALE